MEQWILVYPILQLPNPILRKKLLNVSRVDKKLLEFLKNFQETLGNQKDPEGLGLSANQVGREYRIFLGRIGKSEIRLFINPEIIEFSEEKIIMTEGCLSIKNLYSKIERPAKVKLKYQTIKSWQSAVGSWQKKNDNLLQTADCKLLTDFLIEEFSGLPARVIQHEVDHLNGVVFIDHALRQKAPIFRLVKHKDEKDEFVEVKI